MKLIDSKNGNAISETANPVGDSRSQAFGSGQQNLLSEDFGTRMRTGFYKKSVCSKIVTHRNNISGDVRITLFIRVHKGKKTAKLYACSLFIHITPAEVEGFHTDPSIVY